MPTLSKYVTDDDIAKAEQGIAEVDHELGEVALAESAGLPVAEQKAALLAMREKFVQFVNTYKVIQEQPKRRSNR